MVDAVNHEPGTSGQWDRVEPTPHSKFSIDATNFIAAAGGLGRFVRDVGIPGALLFVIAYAGIYHLPNALVTIQEGYRELQSRHEAERKLDAERHDKQVDKLTATIDKHAAATNSLVDEFRREREFRRAAEHK